MRRIERRQYKVGSGDAADPEAIEELEERRAKHERVTRGKPSTPFGDVLKARQKALKGEEEEEPEEERQKGARDPLLGLNPGQSSALSNRPAGKRAGKVIVKG